MLPPPFEDLALAHTVPLAAAAVIALAALVVSLLRLVRRGQLLAVPLAPEQQVELAAPGEMELWLEGGPLRRAPGELTVSLRERASGIAVETQRPWMRLRISGFRRSWRHLCSFRLERGGTYDLLAVGIDAAGASGLRLVFARPLARAIVVRIVAIVLADGVLIAALVASALLGKGSMDVTPTPRQENTLPRPPGEVQGGGARAEQTAGGRAILATAAPTAGWQEVEWKAGVRLLAPNGWQVVANDAQELMLRQPARGFYLSLRLTRFDVVLSLAQLSAGMDESATMRLRGGAIAGWRALPLGPSMGIAEVPVGGQLAVLWRGFVERGGMPHALDCFIGGGAVADRAELEEVFAAVLASLRLE